MTPEQGWFAAIDPVLMERGKEWPLRGEAYHRSQELLRAFGADLFEQTCRRQPPGEALQTFPESLTSFLASPLFICGHMKSGTTLLGQLLDCHPSLVVLPGDSHYAQEHWTRGILSAQDYAINWILRIVNPTGQPPYWFLGEDERTYFQFFSRMLALLKGSTSEEAFLAVVTALAEVAGTEARAWVEKTPGNEHHVDQLLNRHPEARFLHIVRNPLANLASLKRLYQVRGWVFDAGSVARSLAKSHTLARANASRLGPERYLVLRYEDIVADTQAAMRQVAVLAGVTYNDSMLVPSVGGRGATANSMFAADRVIGKVKSASPESEAVRKNVLDRHEQTILRMYAAATAEKLGYQLPQPCLWECIAARCCYLPRRLAHITSAVFRR
jgi:hypothetical protein